MMTFNFSNKWYIGMAMIVLSAGITFANGTVEDDDYGYYGRNGNRGMYGNNDMHGNRGMMDDWQDMDTKTVEGTFTMVDGEYPAIITNSGETFYLLMHSRLDEYQIPEEGTDMKINAVQSPMSPVHLMVISGEAGGVAFESDWNEPGMMGGRSMKGGYNCDMDENGDWQSGYGMRGNRGMNGAPQGWGQ